MVRGEVTYQLTASSLASGQRSMLMASFLSPRYIAYILLVGCVIFAFNATTHRIMSWTSAIGMFAWLFGFCAGVQLLLVAYVSIAARGQLGRIERLRIPYTLKWGDGDFEWTSSRTRHSYTRTDIVRSSESGKRFVMLTNDNMVWIIDKPFFRTPEDVANLSQALAGR